MQAKNFRERISLPVCLLVSLLFFIIVVVPCGDMHRMFRGKEGSLVASLEIDKSWQEYEGILSRAELKGKDYGPEDYVQDSNILMPLKHRYKFALLTEDKKNSSDGGIVVRTLCPAFRGGILYLERKALDNFPRYSFPGKVSPKEAAANVNRWNTAIEGMEKGLLTFEQIFSSAKLLSRFYLLFLPFGFVLICFHLWKSKRSILHEMLFEPKTFFLSVLKGPVGILHYSEIDPVVSWRYLKLRSEFGKWKLTPEEEAALWLQAIDQELTFEEAMLLVTHASDIVVKRSKMAVLVGYGVMMFSMPFLAVKSTVSHQLAVSQQMIVSLFSLPEDEDEEEELQLFEAPIAVMITRCFRWPQNRKPVEVEPGRSIIGPWVRRDWRLPRRLAPPLNEGGSHD